MSDSKTEQILQIVSLIKDAVKETTKESDKRKRDLERKARSKQIDLFGSTVLSEVSEIVTETKRYMNDYYVSMQAYVIETDRRCKPLLDDQTPLSAVKAVMDLIIDLNEKSNITADFRASLDYSPSSEVAEVNYTPSMECMMIQKEWENRYRLSPQYITEQKRFAEETAAAKQNASGLHQRYDDQKRSIVSQYQHHAQVKEGLLSRARVLEQEFKKILDSKISSLTKQMKSDVEAAISDKKAELKSLQDQLINEKGLSSDKKTALEKQIFVTEETISHLQMQAIEHVCDQWMKDEDNALKKYRSSLNAYVDSGFSTKTVTFELENPKFNLPLIQDSVSKDILTALDDLSYSGSQWIPVGELIMYVKDNWHEELNQSQLSAKIRHLCDSGHILRIEKYVSGDDRPYVAPQGTPCQGEVKVLVAKEFFDKDAFPAIPVLDKLFTDCNVILETYISKCNDAIADIVKQQNQLKIKQKIC